MCSVLPPPQGTTVQKGQQAASREPSSAQAECREDSKCLNSKFMSAGQEGALFLFAFKHPPPRHTHLKIFLQSSQSGYKPVIIAEQNKRPMPTLRSQQQAGTAATEASLRHPKIIWQPATTDTAFSPRLPQALTSLFWHNTTGLP